MTMCKQKPAKIFLADDHAVIRQGLRLILEKESDFVVVGEADNGFDAIRMACLFKPDIVLLDISMPKMGGLDALKGIKKRVPTVRVVMLTAYDCDEYVLACLNAGAFGYLAKTASPSTVVESLREVLRGRTVLQPGIGGDLIRRITCKEKDREIGPLQRDTPCDGLSERELEVLRLVANGLTNIQIADKMKISNRTVQFHLDRIFDKLGIRSRAGAVMIGISRGILKVKTGG